MKNKLIGIIAVAIIAAFAASPAFSFIGGCSDRGCEARHQDRDKKFARELSLTPEQDRLLKEAKAAHRTEMEAFHKEMEAAHDALKAELEKPGATKEQVRPTADRIKKLQSEMVDKRIAGILQIKSILTPEQFKKLGEMMGRHGPKGPHEKHGWKSQ